MTYLYNMYNGPLCRVTVAGHQPLLRAPAILATRISSDENCVGDPYLLPYTIAGSIHIAPSALNHQTGILLSNLAHPSPPTHPASPSLRACTPWLEASSWHGSQLRIHALCRRLPWTIHQDQHEHHNQTVADHPR
ncbi:hypothetical protein AHAS_Ahas15G0389100 [Arachis hypogaea]